MGFADRYPKAALHVAGFFGGLAFGGCLAYFVYGPKSIVTGLVAGALLGELIGVAIGSSRQCGNKDA